MEQRETAAILQERGKTHGNYSDHARITQALKALIWAEIEARHDRQERPRLTSEMCEALDMICHKIGRIIAGQADFADHWEDIAGYAKLVANECQPSR